MVGFLVNIFVRSNNRRRKAHPGDIARHAKLRAPRRDCNCSRVACFLFGRNPTFSLASLSVSCGRVDVKDSDEIDEWMRKLYSSPVTREVFLELG